MRADCQYMGRRFGKGLSFPECMLSAQGRQGYHKQNSVRGPRWHQATSEASSEDLMPPTTLLKGRMCT